MISVGARGSKLARAQVQEVLEELRSFHPNAIFVTTFFETSGDKDQLTSLRTLAKTDFFTKEIDEAQLKNHFRVSIHSAKDLPEPLAKGLKRIALTSGKDSRDVLVLRDTDTLYSLKKNATIACSSYRREEAIKALRSDFICTDIRGTIEKRLEVLFQGTVDGVVVAKAALIRLQLEKLNHIILDCKPTQFQGRLAVIAREDDHEMEKLFSCIDRPKKKRLYLGLELPDNNAQEELTLVHCPIIETKLLPQKKEHFLQLEKATHLIMTSKMAVRYFMKMVQEFAIHPQAYLEKPCFSVGKETTSELKNYGFTAIHTAAVETSEGIVQLIQSHALVAPKVKIFWPHSAKSRDKISNFLHTQQIQLIDCILYDTFTKKPEFLPTISDFDEIFFSSPSTCDAYIELFGALPKNITLLAQGPVTLGIIRKLTFTAVEEENGSDLEDFCERGISYTSK